jgi:uncharacterized protein YrrD
MRKAKELIGKAIVHQTTGEHLATVRDLLFDNSGHHTAALLVDSGGWFRDARVIAWDRISTISDVIMVQGDNVIVRASEAPELAEQMKGDVRLTGLPVMSDGGERIGTVGDLFIDDAGTVVGYEVKQGFLSGNRFLFADRVQTVGRDALIADPEGLSRVKDAQRAIEERKAEPASAGSYPEPQPSVVSPIDSTTATSERYIDSETGDAVEPRRDRLE